MKFKSFLVLAFVALSSALNAQYNPPSQEMHERLTEEELEVVLTGDASFDDVFKTIFQEEWTVGKYRFISESEFKSTHQDKDKILALVVSTGRFQVPISASGYGDMKNKQFLGLITRFLSKEGKYDKKYVDGYLLDVPTFESSVDNVTMRLFIRGLNNDGFNYKEMKKLQKEFSETKLVVISEEHLLSESEIEEIYGGDVQMLSAVEAEKMLNSGEDVLLAKQYTFIIEGPVGNQGSMHYSLVEAKTGKLVSFMRSPFNAKRDADRFAEKKSKAESDCFKALGKQLK